MSASPTAFVTGGTGFVGSHLVEHLLETGYREVRCLVRNKLKWLKGLAITPVWGDLTNRQALEQGCKGADVIYHLAGITRARQWSSFQQINIDATRQLLDTVSKSEHPVQRVVVTSSLAAVGSGANGVATEKSPLKPVSQYGRSKALMEQVLTKYYKKLPVTVVRPPAVYGPRDRDIYTFFQMIQYGVCPVVGSPARPRLSLVHVQDLVQGMVQAAHSDQTIGETYFIGSEKPYSWREIKDAASRSLDQRAWFLRIPRVLVQPIAATAETVGRLMNTYPAFNRDKARELLLACTMCDITKAQQTFGYNERIPLTKGIADTITWYRDQNWL